MSGGPLLCAQLVGEADSVGAVRPHLSLRYFSTFAEAPLSWDSRLLAVCWKLATAAWSLKFTLAKAVASFSTPSASAAQSEAIWLGGSMPRILATAVSRACLIEVGSDWFVTAEPTLDSIA